MLCTASSFPQLRKSSIRNVYLDPRLRGDDGKSLVIPAKAGIQYPQYPPGYPLA